jgi:hypothetical protein
MKNNESQSKVFSKASYPGATHQSPGTSYPDTSDRSLGTSYPTLEEAFDAAEYFVTNLTPGVDYTHENILEISVNDYLVSSSQIRNKYKGYRVIPTILKRKQFSELTPLVYGISVESIGEGEYFGFQIDGNGRFLLGDFTVTHNSTLMENFAYYRKHLYPVARIFIGTEEGYKRCCKIYHPLFVSNYWDEAEEEKHVRRQRTCELKNGRGYTGNYAINIIDDIGDDPKVYRTKLMRGLFKLGSQHWAQLLMVGSQYAIDLPPDVRKATSYVALAREPEENERKKLYNNFGGIVGSYDRFCDLMDQLTGDYTFLIFKKRSQSNALEDCVFYFRTKKLGNWSFGCKEYKEWGRERYDTKYVEKIY